NGLLAMTDASPPFGLTQRHARGKVRRISLGDFPMPISQKVRDLVLGAWGKDAVCLLATIGKDGPNISPKGSMIVFDDEHLAYWERSKRKALENVTYDPRVVVIYS